MSNGTLSRIHGGAPYTYHFDTATRRTTFKAVDHEYPQLAVEISTPKDLPRDAVTRMFTNKGWKFKGDKAIAPKKLRKTVEPIPDSIRVGKEDTTLVSNTTISSQSGEDQSKQSEEQPVSSNASYDIVTSGQIKFAYYPKSGGKNSGYIRIQLSKTIYSALGEPERVEVLLGEGDLTITPYPDGSCEVIASTAGTSEWSHRIIRGVSLGSESFKQQILDAEVRRVDIGAYLYVVLPDDVPKNVRISVAPPEGVENLTGKALPPQMAAAPKSPVQKARKSPSPKAPVSKSISDIFATAQRQTQEDQLVLLINDIECLSQQMGLTLAVVDGHIVATKIDQIIQTTTIGSKGVDRKIG